MSKLELTSAIGGNMAVDLKTLKKAEPFKPRFQPIKDSDKKWVNIAPGGGVGIGASSFRHLTEN